MKNIKRFSEFVNEAVDFYQGDREAVKIVKCDDENQWYKDFVGQVFIVIDDNSRTKWDDGIERWKVVPDNDWFGRTKGVSYIKKTDSELEEGIELPSVGSVLIGAMVYPMYNTGKPDLDNGSPVDDEVDDYWENSLSEKDKEIWSLYSSMEF
jgi:hypothetical protein